MFHTRKQLDVCGESTPHFRSWCCGQTQGEFTLKHEHRGADDRSVREEFEHERRRDLVRRVGDADVEIREIGFDEIAKDDFEFLLLGPEISWVWVGGAGTELSQSRG